MKSKKTIVLALCLVLAVSGVVAFFGVHSATEAAEKPARVWNVSTNEEAEQIAGYKIYSPAYVPSDFELRSAIMIGTVGRGPHSFKVVNRVWTSKSDPTVSFTLSQKPKYIQVSEAQPAQIGGTPGERAFMEATDTIPAAVVLSWERDTTYFSLYGVLKAPLSEQALQKIAVSIQSGS